MVGVASLEWVFDGERWHWVGQWNGSVVFKNGYRSGGGVDNFYFSSSEFLRKRNYIDSNNSLMLYLVDSNISFFLTKH